MRNKRILAGRMRRRERNGLTVADFCEREGMKASPTTIRGQSVGSSGNRL